MNKNTNVALALCEALWASTTMHYEHVIAGGAARNTRYGLEPKDYDVLIVGPDSEPAAFELITQLSNAVSSLGGSSQCYFAYGQAADEVTTEWKDDFCQRLYACLKVSFEDISLDLLIQRAQSLEEAIECFDCNLNQYIIESVDGQFGSARYVGKHPEDELHFLKDVRSYRRAKMNAFFEQHVKVTK